STDVAIMDSNVARGANKSGIFQKVSADGIPNMSHVKKGIVDTGDYGPVAQVDAVGLLYNPEAVKPEPTSWDVLWDSKYKDRVSVVKPPSQLAFNLTMITAKMQDEDF